MTELYDTASAILDREHVGYFATAHYMPCLEAPTACAIVVQARESGSIIDTIDCQPEDALEVIDTPWRFSPALCDWLNGKPPSIEGSDDNHSIEGLSPTCF